MNAVTSITAAKMKALREAKKLGCSGAHQTSDGIWRPCSSAEALAKIVPSTPSGVSSNTGPRRQQRGNNNMQRQWESLGARGVVAIDTLSGGGLVSGVVGKQYQPAAPRDEDPDVFTDIEAARDRSRQLGCIGVSRRLSRSGRTIWMPCTNMTDLANRTGRTSLGRRNMQKRTERFIADVVKRNQPKAMRSRKKSLYDELHQSGSINTKGLGPKVGRRIGRGLRAAPSGFVFIDVTGAIDADKDGIVFEGLPLERPIIPRFIIPEGTARRVQNLVGTTALANEQNRRNGLSVDGAIDKTVLSQIIGVTPNDIPDRREDPLLSKLRNALGPRKKPSTYAQSAVMDDERVQFGDPDLEISRASARLGKRETAGVIKALDAVDDEYEFLTTGELNDLVAQLIPGSNEELMDALKLSPYTRKNAKQIYKRIVDSEPDYEATLLARKILQDELFRNAGVRNAIRRYGLPPIVVTGYEPDIDNMGFIDITSGPRMWQSIIGGYAPNGFIAFNSGVFPDPDTGRIRDSLFRNEDLDSLIRHELAHAWQFMAAKQGGPARDYLVSLYSELQENLQQGRGNPASQNYSEALYRSVTWGSEQERVSARRISDYAETARIEWFAESFAAFTDDDPSRRMRVDNTSIKNMADVWGMSVNEFLTFIGERNQGQLSERARSSSTRSVSNLLLGDMSKPEKEAHDWLLNNPTYIADAPDAMLLRLPPDTIDNFIRNQRLSTRSRYNTDISKAEARAEEARRNGELGQRVLDTLFARATGENSSARPTMWFIGGTTGSGKSTLRNNGILTDVPNVDTAVDIDPDVIKSMHPDWDNGRGASAVHGWSTQWALYGMRQATAQNRDYVVTGTGVRVDQMLIGKDNGYKIIGHYVHVPTDIAEKRMASRGKQGGVQLPPYLASQYAAELQWKVRKAITNGYMDEFHLWDNSQDNNNATLAAIRREDGTFEIFNRKVFDEFFGKEGALAVEKYWEIQRADATTGSVLASTRSSSQHSGFSTRSSRNRNLPERLIVDSLPNRRTTLYRKDLRGKRTPNAELSNIVFGSDVDLSDSDWNSAYFYGVTADNLKTSQPINFSNAVLKAVSLKNTIIPAESSMKRSTLERVAFDGSDIFDVDFSETSLRGVDFSKAKVGNINLRGAILERAEFDVADLSNSGLTIDQLQGSGIIWTDRTKFSPEIQQFINSLPSGQVLKNNGKYSFKVNAESTTPINRADKGYAQLRQMILGRRQIEIPTPQSDGQVISGIDATGGKISDADWNKLAGNRITKSYMDRLSAIKQNLADIKITHSWMDRAQFTGSRLQDVSLAGSSLRDSSFRGSDIRGVLNLRGTDLREADFVGAKVDVDALMPGTIDLRGSDLTGAKLGSIPLGKLKIDDETTLTGAVWNGPTLMIPKNLRDRGLRGTRSMSRQTSYGAAIQINDLSDRLSNATRLSSREKTELIQDMSSMYRELLDSKIERPERQEFADFIESLKDASSKDLDRFRVPSMDKRPMLLIESVRANNKESFVERFKKVRENEPEFMRGLSAIQAWKQASAAADKADELENLHMQTLDELREERAVAQSLPQLQNILHGDFLDADNRKRPTGKLPSGKRAKETVITSTESTRSTRSALFRAGRPRPMTEDEKQRFQPLNLKDGEKIKIDSGVKLIFANEDDQVFATQIVGPQVMRFRGIPGQRVYIDPSPPEQDFINERMQEWERLFGPPSDPRRRTSSNQSGGGARRPAPSQSASSAGGDEDALERIIAEAEENKRTRERPLMSSRSIQSSRSTRLIASTTPQLRISEDGSRVYMDASAKDSFLRNPKGLLDGLTDNDIPEGYFPKGERNKLEKYKQDLLALATLDSLVPNTEGYGVSARNLFAIDVFDDSKPNPPGILRRDVRKNVLGTKRTEKIFHQADVASLRVGEALFVTDIPATSKMSAIDNAIIFRNTDGSLSLLEIDDTDELDVIEELMDEAESRVNENGVGVFMLDDIIPPSTTRTVSPIVQVLENYHTTIADIDPRIPRPNIIFKADFFAQQIPGLDSRRIAGTAYPDANSIVMWQTSEQLPSVDIMLHEFGHNIDFTLGYRTVMDDRDIPYSSNYAFSSVADDWEPAMNSDQAHGLLFGTRNIPIAVLSNMGRAKQPTSIPGTTYQDIAPEVDALHGPRIGDKFITQYANDSEQYVEDFAESASLFLRDKMFGYVTSVTDPSGERREYTFAEMYPNRAAILEKVLYPNTRSASNFDKRFNSAYGANPIYGDGDCYEAASSMANRLRGEEFGFSDDQIRIVHGIPLGTGGDAMGIRYGHAWAEVAKNGWDQYEQLRNEIAEVLREAETLTSQSLKNSLAARHNKLMMELVRMELEDVAVYDFSNGNEHIIPKYLYYKIGNIEDENTRYYSRRDADIKMQADETYGPWE